MHKFYILTSILIIYTNTSIARQPLNIDSLLVVSNTAESPLVQCESILLLAHHYAFDQTEKSKKYSRRLPELISRIQEAAHRAKLHSKYAALLFISNQYVAATEEYLKSRALWEKLNNKKELLILNNNLGLVYERKGEYDKAIPLFKTAYRGLDLFEPARKHQLRASICLNLGSALQGIDRLEQAHAYYVEAIRSAEISGFLLPKAKALHNLGNLSLALEKNNLAKIYFEQSLHLKDSLGETSSQFSDLIGLARYHLAVNDTDIGLKYIQQAATITSENQQAVYLQDLHLLRHSYFLKTHQMDSALNYYKAYKIASDKLQRSEQTDVVSNLIDQYELDKKNEATKRGHQKWRWRMYMGLAIAVGLIISLVLLGLYLKQKLQKEREATQRIQAEKELVEQQLDFKNRELVNNVTHLVQKNELINTVSQRLFEFKSKLRMDQRKNLTAIIEHLQNINNDNTWEEFSLRFNAVHSNFYKILEAKHGKLTNNERKLSALLRMDMNTKEVSAITGQSPKAIEVARTRLRKKLQIDNTEINLSNYLQGIETQESEIRVLGEFSNAINKA
ncbi:tetratricopeptide repeat protein [Persicobacter psychrovividus]|uniref:Tetratricopeptide repeat protein n=1 Tax=Persicobacter psychrovividus TaxID=387638 RepID=A0ABM7VLI9_9BACT|nr:hypothetical protein PEPS_41270 [Persicobacter psychrovividus]